MALRLTRQQRINNVGSSMVNSLTQVATQYRDVLTNGLDVKAEGNLPAMKATAEEVRESVGENAVIIETVIAYILDGKSNKIMKAVRASRKKSLTR